MHRLMIRLTDLEGALLRLLGTAERRGWRPVNLSASRWGDQMTVDLTVRGEGSVDLLTRQLGRLHEVADVRYAALAEEVSA